jgi:hypothetical protein
VAGQVAVEGSIGYPRGAFLTPRRYRVEAVLSAERIVIEGLDLHDVRAVLLYQDGVARLRELAFTVPHGEAPPGRVAGNATLPLAPAGDLIVNLDVIQLPVERLLEMLPGLEDFAEGRLSGEVRGQVNPGRLSDPAAWRLMGEARLDELAIQEYPPLDATVRFETADGVLTVTGLEGVMRTARLAGSGRLGLEAPYPFTADVQLADEQLAWLGDLPEVYRPPFPVEGAVRLTGRAQGQLDPVQWRVDGAVAGERLDFGETEVASVAGDCTALGPIDPLGADEDALPPADAPPWRIGGDFRIGALRTAGLLVDSAAAQLAIDPQRINAPALTATLYGGAARGSAEFPLTGMRDALLELRLQQVDLGRLLADMNVLDFPLRGEAEGVVDVAIPVDDPDDVDRWRGVGRLMLSEVAVLGMTQGAALAEFQLDRGRLLLPNLTAAQGAMRLHVSGSVGLRAPHTYAVTVEGSRFDLSRLNALPPDVQPPVELAGVANFEVTGSGDLAPFTFVGRGAAAVAELHVNDVRAESVAFALDVGQEHVQILRLRANLYGGQATGEGVWPLTEAAPAQLELHWREVNLGRLLDDALELPVSLEGISTGDVTLPRPRGQWMTSGSGGSTRTCRPRRSLSMESWPAPSPPAHKGRKTC